MMRVDRHWRTEQTVLFTTLLAFGQLFLTVPGMAQGADAAQRNAAQNDAAAADNEAVVLPRVHVIATGGTIAGAGYAEVEDRDGSALLAAVPEVFEVARVTAEDPMTVGSSQLTPAILFDIAQRVNKVLAEDPELAGVVVTQGTDSLEEAAFLLDLLVDDPRPVVYTGAMRQPGQMAAEGGRNLINAVRLAASPAARNLGVLVTMNDEIHAAREICKLDSTSVNAFESTSGGRLGFIDGGSIYLVNAPRRRVSLSAAAIEPKVDLLTVTAGSDGHVLSSMLESSPKGIVIELFGRGNLPGSMIGAIIQAMRQGVRVVFTSRTRSGGLREDARWEQGGVIYAEDLGGLKARVALMVALGAGITDPTELQEIFDKLAGQVRVVANRQPHHQDIERPSG